MLRFRLRLLLIIAFLTLFGCNGNVNQTEYYEDVSLDTIDSIALITFVANEDLTVGKYSSGFNTRTTSDPYLVQSVSQVIAANLHDLLILNQNTRFISLLEIQKNEYYRSLSDRFPLEYRSNFWSKRQLINALPKHTVYIPIEEKDTIARLASELNVDGILWVNTSYYLDVDKSSSLLTGHEGTWIAEMLVDLKLIDSYGQLVWEASRFIKTEPVQGADDTFWKKLDNSQSIDGEAVAELLTDLSETAPNRIAEEIKMIMNGGVK